MMMMVMMDTVRLELQKKMMISSSIKVCKINELPDGQSKCLRVNDKEVAVFNVKGKYYAIDNTCIHAGAPLNDGHIDEEKCQVICSWHGWGYDLATGKCVTHPRQDVFAGSYPVKILGDEIFIEIK